MKITNEPIEIAENVWWIGIFDKEHDTYSASYVIKNENSSILIDPGSLLFFSDITLRMAEAENPKHIKHIILTHQDPDICSTVPVLERLVNRKDLTVYAHEWAKYFIDFYGIRSKLKGLEFKGTIDIDFAGYLLKLIHVPYCHSPGAIMVYDPKTKMLFSGDVFGASNDKDLAVYSRLRNVEHFKEWQAHIIASEDAKQNLLKRIDALDLNLIAPQHGSMIEREYIEEYLDILRNLKVGAYLDA